MSEAIDERVAKHLKMYERDLSIDCNPIIKATAQAKVHVIRTAPRDVNKLLIEIALKQEEFNNETRFPERELLRAQLNALEWMRDMIRSLSTGPS